VRSADWLVAAQDPDGAWRRFASPFATHTVNTYNTRVAFALAKAGRDLQEPRYLDAAVRNVEWALTQMHPNGWLENNDLEDNDRPLTHTIAYATRGILEVGLIAGNGDFVETASRMARAVAQSQRRDGALPGRLDAAVRIVEWALTQMHPNGWLENNDLEDNDRPLTHTIAYATRGILEVGLIARNSNFVEMATRMAQAVAQSQRRDGALPGRLDADWRPASRWSCVTGNAQMAIIWQRLAAETGDRSCVTAAENAIRFNLSIQDLTAADMGIRGGMPGSHPRSGGYMKNRYPNWAAKFFMDAILLQLDAN
jgi:hypothetical protein